MHNSGLENAIQEFMGRSLTQISSIDKQLELMRKFKEILHREALQEDLEHKYLAIFKLYGEDLHAIQALYEKHKHDPPIPRNMPRIAGNIHWSRQLLRRITSPMRPRRSPQLPYARIAAAQSSRHCPQALPPWPWRRAPPAIGRGFPRAASPDF